MSLPCKLSNFVRSEFEDTCRRRFFFGPSFDAYGGTSGLYDFGPPMCAIKVNFLSYWRKHFVLEESMCEVDTTTITPEEVFKASGHVTRFNDIMIRDTISGECIRADKLVEEFCELKLGDKTVNDDAKVKYRNMLIEAGGMNQDELAKVIEEHKIMSPKNNPLSDPFPFNLMFKTLIGPEGHKVGYLRPELAQGIILNFKRLVDSGNAPSKLPFAAACIGTAFRNEIAPRAALIRVREFTLAEIEHFVDPEDKAHPKYEHVKDVMFWCYSREIQKAAGEPVQITIQEAFEKKIIDNQTVAYFIGRTQLFMNGIGVKVCRFRQHLATEMAHYAQDCWDCELLSSYGFVECVGIADRSAYDLDCHMVATGKELKARVDFLNVEVKEILKAKVDKGKAGKSWGKNNKEINTMLDNLSEEEAQLMMKRLADGPVLHTVSTGESVEITSAMVTFEKTKVKITGRNFTPSVVEPSFGVGRILYILLEQSYWVRSDESGKNDKRAVFSLSPILAPQNVAILPLMVKAELEPVISKLKRGLIDAGMSSRTDDSGAGIGKKYARIDELGIPFIITCDFEGDGAVTLRERDSASQVRVPVDEVVSVVQSLCSLSQSVSWASVVAKYPAHIAK
eukprot:Tbor_TRINITY_DN5462_c0_g1::TRINITY_DN5462_c0_g1_i1::g.25268::m.25268/K01880/GARS, glyS1; glycyl-tRNA synthetase